MAPRQGSTGDGRARGIQLPPSWNEPSSQKVKSSHSLLALATKPSYRRQSVVLPRTLRVGSQWPKSPPLVSN